MSRVVGERFAHAHDDEVVERGHLGAGAGREGVLAVADVEELATISPAESCVSGGEAGGAEDAAHGAADLRQDADGLARVSTPTSVLRGARRRSR
jgi:hypothetical protein